MRDSRSIVYKHLVLVCYFTSLISHHTQLLQSQWILRVIDVPYELEYLKLIKWIIEIIIKLTLTPFFQLAFTYRELLINFWLRVLHDEQYYNIKLKIQNYECISFKNNYRQCILYNLCNIFSKEITLLIFRLYRSSLQSFVPPFMEQKSKFIKEYQKALARYNINKSQAISMLKALVQSPFDDDQWYNYFTAKIQLGGWLRDQSKFQESNAIFTKVINDIKNPHINDKVQSQDLHKIKFNSFYNFARLLSDQAPSYIEKNLYHKYRNKMNGAFSYFKQAQDLLLQKMNNQLKRQGYIKDKEAEQYIRCLSNINSLLLNEIEHFRDQTCMRSILNIAEHAKKFYDLNISKKEKREMESHLYRCYYYKAIVLKIKNKLDQALQLYMKVLRFQTTNNQPQDARKTKGQIFSILLEKNQINKAQQYITQGNNQVQDILKHIKVRRQKIKKALSAPNHEIKKMNKTMFGQLFAEFDLQSNQDRYDYQMMDELIQKILPLFASNSQEKALLYYYLAEANFKMENYEKSYNMIKSALQIPISDKFQEVDYMIERIKILGKWKPNNVDLPQMVQKVKKQIHLLKMKYNNQDLFEDIRSQQQFFQKVLKQWQKDKEKANDKANYQFYNQKENTFFEELKRFSGLYEKTREQVVKNKLTLNDYYEIQSQNIEQKINQNLKTMNSVPLKQNQKMFILNPEDEYSKRCKEKNVPQRAQIKNLIKKSHDFNPFDQMINISYDQMQVLLGVLKIQNLDLRNHQINESVMQKLLNQSDLDVVKQFKINGSGCIQVETLLQAISKMRQLNQLSFLDFPSEKPSSFNLVQMMGYQKMDIQYQKPRSLVHTIYLLGNDPKIQLSQRLRVLKLKYCNLLDGHLPQMKLQNYTNLKEISLSHNLLQGKQLHHIFSLNKISAINLSDNPLISLSIDKWWSHRQSQIGFIISLKLKNVKFESKLRQDLRILIYRVQLLDLSDSENLYALFEQFYQKYSSTGFQPKKLNKLVLKNVDLENINIQNFFYFFSQCREIDFRGCKYDSKTKREIDQKKIQELDMKINISERESQNFTFSKFRLGSTQHH